MSRRRYPGITLGAVALGRRGIGQFDWTSLLNPVKLVADTSLNSGDSTFDKQRQQAYEQGNQLSPATQQELQGGGGEELLVNATGLRLRSTAEIRSDNIVGTLDYGEKVTSTGKVSGIFELVTRGNGQSGWAAVHAQDGSKTYLIAATDKLDPPDTATDIELPDTGGGGGGGILSKVVTLAIPVAGGLLAWKHRSL